MWIVKIEGKHSTLEVLYKTHDEALSGWARAKRKIAFSSADISIKEVV